MQWTISSYFRYRDERRQGMRHWGRLHAGDERKRDAIWLACRLDAHEDRAYEPQRLARIFDALAVLCRHDVCCADYDRDARRAAVEVLDEELLRERADERAAWRREHELQAAARERRAARAAAAAAGEGGDA